MSIVVITGNHPRHHFLVEALLQSGLVSGWVREIRESFVPSPPDSLSKRLSDLFAHHFAEREAAETAVFGKPVDLAVETLDVAVEDLNSKETKGFLEKLNPDLVISYGCHKLNVPYLNPGSAKFWNTHGGLSPEYRGVTTHFWPSYFLEPQMTGMTLHETTEHIDGGNILFQTAGSMHRGDTLHRLAGRTVYEYAEQLSIKLGGLDLKCLPDGKIQRSTGRLFHSSDWRPEHLGLIYETYGDHIVDAVLDGAIIGRTPKLIDQLG